MQRQRLLRWQLLLVLYSPALVHVSCFPHYGDLFLLLPSLTQLLTGIRCRVLKGGLRVPRRRQDIGSDEGSHEKMRYKLELILRVTVVINPNGSPSPVSQVLGGGAFALWINVALASCNA